MTIHLLLAELLEPGFLRSPELIEEWRGCGFDRASLEDALDSPWFEMVYKGWRLSRMGREALKRERGHRPQRRPNEC